MDGRGGEYSSSDGVVNTVGPRPVRTTGHGSEAGPAPSVAGHTGDGRDLRSHTVPSGGLHLVSVSPFVWPLTLVVLTAILVADLVVVARRPREPTLRESALWVTGYILLAIAFGLLISLGYGVGEGGKFFAGWLTEYSLSVDNLFVFMVIMAQFAVPRQYQQKALMIGIV